MALATNYITYLQVISMFRVFADEHREINYFGNGDFWELVETTKAGEFDYRNYPVLWVVDTNVVASDGQLEYNFQIVLADIQHDKDGEDLYENQLKSNTLNIYLDLLAYLKVCPEILNTQVRLFDNGASSGTSFTERFDDNLVGWVFDLSMIQPMKYDKCAIPK